MHYSESSIRVAADRYPRLITGMLVKGDAMEVVSYRAQQNLRSQGWIHY